ncbi:MAG: RusA family crossover junction endodeoxyribonuclease [Phascolarctobacterium sp.]|nr:RusA family crossover junction endodeoxyribonuclease [Phascolarctobacterium sp.]
MPIRFVSEEQLIFAVGGRALSRGNPAGHGISGGVKEFRTLVGLAAKMAMAEQGWKKTDKAVYMAITIYLAPSSAERMHYKPSVEKLANDKIFAIKSPNVERMATIIVNTLGGLVYEKSKQVVGLTVIKKFSKEPRVEVLVGKPNNFKEFMYDLRNA